MRVFTLVCFVVLCGLVMVQGQTTSTVSTSQGNVFGLQNVAQGVNAFYGIPFASPPSGSLRFAPPVSTASQPFSVQTGFAASRYSASSGYNATQQMPQCLQPQQGDPSYSGSEDCLYLDVYVPSSATSTSNLPVFVWIYGGGFVIGNGTSVPGANIVQASLSANSLGSEATDGVIMVVLNYRVGAFGFLAHPLLSADNEAGSVAASGNQGIKDQIAALQWVQTNIASYGGNPSKVTIGGESAGAISVCILHASPLARGLFSQAILESGGCDNSGNGQATTLAAAEYVGTVFVSTFIRVIKGAALSRPALAPLAELCNQTNTEILLSFCLRFDNALVAPLFLSAAALIGVNNFFGPTAMIPMVDGVVATDYPFNIETNGNFTSVPLLIGTNFAEMALFLEPIAAVNTSQFGSVYDSSVVLRNAVAYSNGVTDIQATYTPANFAAAGPFAGFTALQTLLSRAIFQCPSLRLAQAAANKGATVYAYRFDFVDPVVLSGQNYGVFTQGTIHAGELPYVFNQPAPPANRVSPFANTISFTVKSIVQNYWIKFIMTGDPNYGSSPLPALASLPAAFGGITTNPTTWPQLTTSGTFPASTASNVMNFNRTGGQVVINNVYPDCATLWSRTVSTREAYQPTFVNSTSGLGSGSGVNAATGLAAPSAAVMLLAAIALAFSRMA